MVARLIRWSNNVIKVPDSCHFSILKTTTGPREADAVPNITPSYDNNLGTTKGGNRRKRGCFPAGPLLRVRKFIPETPRRLSPEVTLATTGVSSLSKSNSSKNRIIMIGLDQSGFTSRSQKRRVDPQIKALPIRKREQWQLRGQPTLPHTRWARRALHLLTLEKQHISDT